MALGDHFFVWRRHRCVPYQHHAIDCGDGTVVHFTDGKSDIARPGVATQEFEVRRTSIAAVTRDGRDSIHVVSHCGGLPPADVVRRAVGQVGRRGYDVLFDNCEHFASWCVVGQHESRQISSTCERLGSVSVKAIAAGTSRFVAKASARRVVSVASPWMIVADAAQWITEAGGHHVGLRDPDHRKQAGRAVGITTALGIGACAGPAGVVAAGGLWAAGELAGEVSRRTYERAKKSSQQAVNS